MVILDPPPDASKGAVLFPAPTVLSREAVPPPPQLCRHDVLVFLQAPVTQHTAPDGFLHFQLVGWGAEALVQRTKTENVSQLRVEEPLRPLPSE